MLLADLTAFLGQTTGAQFSDLSWSAIFGGVVATMVIHGLLILLGGAITASAKTAHHEGTAIASLLGWTAISAFIALFLGGLLTGYFATPHIGDTTWYNDATKNYAGHNRTYDVLLYGLLMWGVLMILGVILVSRGIAFGLQGVMGIAKGAADIGSNLVGGAVSGVGQAVGGVASGLGNIAGGAVSGVGQAVGGVASGVGRAVGGVASGVGQAAGGVASGVGKAAGGVASGVGTAAGGAAAGAGAIAASDTEAANKAKEEGQRLLDKLPGLDEESLKKAGFSVEQLNQYKPQFEKLRTQAQDAYAEARKKAEEYAAKAGEYLGQAKDKAGEYLGQAQGKAQEYYGQAKDKASDLASQARDAGNQALDAAGRKVEEVRQLQDAPEVAAAGWIVFASVAISLVCALAGTYLGVKDLAR